MVTLAQRLEALRMAKGLSRPALAAALDFPRLSIEKFETGRLTPNQDQQTKLAAYFGVSLMYLRGETDDPVDQSSWMQGDMPFDADEPAVATGASAYRPAAPARTAPVVAQSGSDGADGAAMFRALLKSEAFRNAVLEVLRSPEGQQLLNRTVQKEVYKHK